MEMATRKNILKKYRMNSLKPNLSDTQFFELYVKDKNWHPLQNHGLIDNEIKLQDSDKDFPNQIISYLNLFKNIEINNQSILDIGCSAGFLSRDFQKYNYTGVDYSEPLIEKHKTLFPDHNVKVAEANSLLEKLVPSLNVSAIEAPIIPSTPYLTIIFGITFPLVAPS